MPITYLLFRLLLTAAALNGARLIGPWRMIPLRLSFFARPRPLHQPEMLDDDIHIPSFEEAATLAPDAAHAPDAAPPVRWHDLRTRIAPWIRAYWQEIVLIAVIVGVWLSSWIIAARTNLPPATLPGTPGRPFYWLHYVREFELSHGTWWAPVMAGVCALIGLGFAALAWCRRSPSKPDPAAQAGLAVTAVGLAGLGQLTALGFADGSAAGYYALAAGCFIVWAITYRTAIKDDLISATWPRWFEIGMLVIALAVTIFARFYALGSIPYGLEGDESKWTVEVISTMIGNAYPGSADYHFSSVPLSFYMQVPFQYLLGPGILSARIAVASYSVMGSLIFYWLARQISAPSVSWLATMLLAVSPFDVSASRLANVESHVKLWPLLALALLARATRTGKLLTYFLAGVVVALGLLTYDTVAPLLGVVLIIVLYELVRARISVAESLRRLTALVLPIALVIPMTLVYLVGRLTYYQGDASAISSSNRNIVINRLFDGLWALVTSLFKQTAFDFLYNRDGPVFNSLLLPWLVFGVVLVAVCWYHGKLGWVVVFGSLFFLPVPMLAHTPMGRVLYPGLPAAYLSIAFALVATYRVLGRAVHPALRPVLAGLAVLSIICVSVLNLYIYFNEVLDFDDRTYRRELYDMATQVASAQTMVYFPYEPVADDPIEQENEQLIMLGMRQPEKRGALYPYHVLPLASLLPSLANQGSEYERTEIVWDTVSEPMRKERDHVLAGLQRCYPGTSQVKGKAFDRYTIPRAVLQDPQCTIGTLALLPTTVEAKAKQPISLNWEMQVRGTPPPALQLECSVERADTLELDAEKLTGPAWESIAEFVTGFEGSGFLADGFGSQPATLPITLPEGRSFYIWVRSLRRVADKYPAYVTLGGESRPVADANSMPLNTWVWQKAGPFTSPSAKPVLTLTRPYDAAEENAFIALFFDTIFVTSSPTFDPAKDPFLRPALQETLPLKSEATKGTFATSLEPGRYQCNVSASDSTKLIDPLGNGVLRSNPVDVLVR